MPQEPIEHANQETTKNSCIKSLHIEPESYPPRTPYQFNLILIQIMYVMNKANLSWTLLFARSHEYISGSFPLHHRSNTFIVRAGGV